MSRPFEDRGGRARLFADFADLWARSEGNAPYLRGFTVRGGFGGSKSRPGLADRDPKRNTGLLARNWPVDAFSFAQASRARLGIESALAWRWRGSPLTLLPPIEAERLPALALCEERRRKTQSADFAAFCRGIESRKPLHWAVDRSVGQVFDRPASSAESQNDRANPGDHPVAHGVYHRRRHPRS